MKHSIRVLLLMLLTIAMVQPVVAQIGITVSFGPPALPVYEQPLCPGDGYLWTPGYWAYDPDYGYYWVPGTWVMAPEPGFLWTPGWWGWEGAGFIFHDGYWANEVGFYGGINYGFGYFGEGFGGGRWEGNVFRYNTAVVNVNTTVIHNTYIDRTVIINNNTVDRTSYNGGQGGISRRATPQEERAAQIRHIPPVQAQTQHIQQARTNPQLRASTNQGRPPIAATERPGSFSGHGVVAAREAGAPYRPPARTEQPSNGRPGAAPNPGQALRPEERPGNPTHASQLPPHEATAPNTGNPKLDQKYEQQQQKLVDKQNQEHQKMVQKQQQEDQRAASASAEKRQQVEQRHQQQTQQLEQRHQQQAQQMQTRQAPRQPAPRPSEPRPR